MQKSMQKRLLSTASKTFWIELHFHQAAFQCNGHVTHHYWECPILRQRQDVLAIVAVNMPRVPSMSNAHRFRARMLASCSWWRLHWGRNTTSLVTIRPSVNRRPGYDCVIAKGRMEPDPSKDSTIIIDKRRVTVPQGAPINMDKYRGSWFSNSEYLLYKASQQRVRYMMTLKFPWCYQKVWLAGRRSAGGQCGVVWVKDASEVLLDDAVTLCCACFSLVPWLG